MLLIACKGWYLGASKEMYSFNYYNCFYRSIEINGMQHFGIGKSYSINGEGHVDSGIIVTKGITDFRAYTGILIKGYISSDSSSNLTVRCYFLAGDAPVPEESVPYDYSSWELLAETDTETYFETCVNISDKGEERISFGLYHGDELDYNTVYLSISEITLIPIN